MALSIKNPHAERLARELARRTGENLTQTVIHALEASLAKIRSERFDLHLEFALHTIAGRCGALPDRDTRGADQILGYDHQGGFG